MSEKEGYFTHGSIPNMILRKSGIMSLGLFTIILFHIIDAYFIGQLGANELAAVGYTFPVMMVIIAITVGIGVGSGAIVAKAIGEREGSLVKKYVTHSLFLATIIVVFISLVMISTIDVLYGFFGASGIVLELIKEYIIVVYASLFLFIVPVVGNYSLRASGDMLTPAVLMGIAGALNGIFDWLLIFGNLGFPELGVLGAAIATFISWAFIFFAEIIILIKRNFIEFSFPIWNEVKNTWRKVLYIGVPASGTQLLFPITNVFLLFLVAKISDNAVAAYGVASRIESILVTFSMAIATVMVSFSGQNFGAKKFDRMRKGFSFSNYSSVILNFILAIIVFFLAYPIASVFNDDLEVIRYIAWYLMIIPISYGFFGLVKINSSICNGLHKPIHATKILLVKTALFTIPFCLIGMYFYGLIGIYFGLMISNFLGGMYGIYVVRNVLKKMN